MTGHDIQAYTINSLSTAVPIPLPECELHYRQTELSRLDLSGLRTGDFINLKTRKLLGQDTE